ncbi:MAG: CvpA family protein [Alphaproteobacteria bacterium]|nr:CvpA family protein [Alphaproteobacteria bacterium]
MNDITQGFSLNPLDVTVVVILIIFGIFSYIRGFTAAALTLAAWGGAFVATEYFAPLVLPKVTEIIQPKIMALVITYAVMFVLSLLVLKLFAGQIGRMVRDSNIGSLDRAMGLLFGLFSGMFVISALYMLTTPFISENNQPEWFKQAKSRPLIQYGASMISAMNPYFDKLDLQEKRKDIEALERMKKLIPSFPENKKDNKKSKGKDEKYQKKNQQEMDKLFKKLSKG